MSRTCKYEGCTVDETGVCALERPASTCENRDGALAEAVIGETSFDSSQFPQSGESLGTPVLNRPAIKSPFPSSRTLGLEDLNALMATRYVNVVGILGDPESGKTACLASLYLLVANAMLKGWSFADSRTLTAFEDIARGAREWNNGAPPEQMTVHTELSDDRQPGFLHLRLVRERDGRRVDFALPDVPGEWTQALITSAESDRFDYMKSAEVIWIVLDGRVLASLEKRQGLIVRVGQLAARLNKMLSGNKPRILLVVTHRDQCAVDEVVVARLNNELWRRQIHAEIVEIAPFSDQPDIVPAGFGISELINQTVDCNPNHSVFWPASEHVDGDRYYLNYRRLV
ncbi:TRAFAC clade GTPase domain-containing protein [Lysobacter enzymogenes]|uniref:TRAFAC clade GTPase domain-containing protein n=1 Tax=Lysobacter enzymogenes TaxID=69 RepID=UPI00089CB940|nr:hypothetical protein [Lysobacter enzymogenes]SDX24566.1 hypothetical protein SAMN05421681_104349 [Lysobacter enzymogenes]